MKNCVKCNKKLTMWNVPSKSVKILKDGNEICASCLQATSKLIPNLRVRDYNQKEFSLAIENAKAQMISRKEKISDLKFGSVEESGIKKTLKDFFSVLNESEGLIGVIHIFDDENRNGGLYLTDQRIICICKGFGLGTKTSDFSYSRISSIDLKSGLLRSKITIHVTGNTSEYTAHDKDLGNKIVKYVREKIVEEHDKPTAIPERENIFDQIEKLSALRDKGIISEDEFNSKKTELLNKI